MIVELMEINLPPDGSSLREVFFSRQLVPTFRGSNLYGKDHTVL
jgi:hypothetical protein